MPGILEAQNFPKIFRNKLLHLSTRGTAVILVMIALTALSPFLQAFLHNHSPGSAQHPDCPACGSVGTLLTIIPPAIILTAGLILQRLIRFADYTLPASKDVYTPILLRAPPLS